MAEVRLENVRKTYEGGFTAVHDLTLTIKDKEFVVLVGPSGCGKTTTLRMIAGLEEVTSGTISIDGKRVNDLPPKDRDIAMVFQNYALYPHMSVYENMAFGLKLRKFSKAEIEKRVKDAASILDIGHLIDRKPKALSGGQRQRVAVGRAIVRKPKVFLFDEPLSNLDAKLRVQMRTEISKLHQRLEATMVYVTHDQTEAMTMADTIVLMKDGFVQQTAHPLEIYNTPVNKFVGGFIGSPAMNFFRGEIKKQSKGFVFAEDGGGLQCLLPRTCHGSLSPYIGKKVDLGIRPEHISLVAGGSGKKNVTATVYVTVVEPMGNEVFVYFTTRNDSALNYVARIAPSKVPKVGEPALFQFDLKNLSFFDPDTEKAIP